MMPKKRSEFIPLAVIPSIVTIFAKKYLGSMQKISTDKAPKPVGLYPHARKAGNLLFLSGVGPRTAGSDKNDSQVPGLKLDHNGNFLEFDFEKQCRSVFNNVKIILEESGSSWENLVDVTVFLVNMKRDFAVYNKIYAEYFKDNLPCRTTVEINSLPTPIAIELKCIATI
jgi:2-aminomuconate deaminase